MKILPLFTLTAVSFAATLIGAKADSTTMPDNTAQNSTANSPSDITPLDQSNDPADIAVTQKIRQALIADKNLSTDAKNIKIITTSNQFVYLRGVVANARECRHVVALAKPYIGDRTLRNEIKNRS